MTTENASPRGASVLLPTWQGMEFLDRVFDAVALQDCPIPWEFVIADSDSTDGTVERAMERANHHPFPVTVLRIRSREFDHGDTRNLLASRSSGALEALTTEDRRALYNFQNVASTVRRSLWERYPFPRTMRGEDVLMARDILEAGYTTCDDGESTVDHSHDYGAEKLRWRGQVDARFNAE